MKMTMRAAVLAAGLMAPGMASADEAMDQLKRAAPSDQAQPEFAPVQASAAQTVSPPGSDSHRNVAATASHSITFQGSGYDEKPMLHCGQNRDNPFTFESLSIAVPEKGAALANLSISSPGADVETYQYQVQKGVPPEDQGDPGVTGYRGEGFSLVLTTVEMPDRISIRAAIIAVRPQSAKVSPGGKLTYELVCTPASDE